MSDKPKWRTGLPPVSDEPYLFRLKHGHDAMRMGWMDGYGLRCCGARFHVEDISGWMLLDEAARILDGKEGA